MDLQKKKLKQNPIPSFADTCSNTNPFKILSGNSQIGLSSARPQSAETPFPLVFPNFNHKTQKSIIDRLQFQHPLNIISSFDILYSHPPLYTAQTHTESNSSIIIPSTSVVKSASHYKPLATSP